MGLEATSGCFISKMAAPNFRFQEDLPPLPYNALKTSRKMMNLVWKSTGTTSAVLPARKEYFVRDNTYHPSLLAGIEITESRVEWKHQIRL